MFSSPFARFSAIKTFQAFGNSDKACPQRRSGQVTRRRFQLEPAPLSLVGVSEIACLCFTEAFSMSGLEGSRWRLVGRVEVWGLTLARCEALRCSESREVRTSSLAGREFPSNGQNHLEQRERESACRRFILDLYHAKPMNGHAWIHGTKSGRMVHGGAVDAPETLADVNGHPRRNAAPHRVLGSRHVVQCFVAGKQQNPSRARGAPMGCARKPKVAHLSILKR